MAPSYSRLKAPLGASSAPTARPTLGRMNQLPSPFAFLALLGSGLACAGAACTSTVVGGGGGDGSGASTADATSSRAAVSSSGGMTSSSSSTGWGTTSSSSGWGTTSSSSGSTTTSTASSGSSGSTCAAGAPLTGACAPTASCAGAGSTCLALVSQPATTTPGFRMAEIVYTKPAAFTTGVVASILQGSTAPNDTACNLEGSGTISWLLRFDTVAGTLETGGAKPVASPAGPYTFDDETVMQGAFSFAVHSLLLTAPLGAGCTFDSNDGDVTLPLFQNSAGTSPVLLPLTSLRLHGGMTADHGCIGRYDAEGLDPANACQPDTLHQSFTGGAALDGLIVLEDADKVVVSPLQESLCVLLAGNAATFGTSGPNGSQVCKRGANGAILFQGDWCAATNQAATATCADAVQVAATFAAQAVQIQ
jgi:hypothetical protein